MGDRDEFDGGSDAPLPPYERVWRHPAEVSDDARRRHAAESAPPPIGRRATMVVAVVSLTASAALLVVTVPKGVDRRPATADTVTSSPTTSSTVTKGHLVSTPALRLTDTYMLIPPDAPLSLRTVSVGGVGTTSVAEVLPFTRFGYSVARADHAVVEEGFEHLKFTKDEIDYLLSGDALRVIDMNGGSLTARWSATTGISSQTPGTYPLDVDPDFSGLGVLVTAGNEVIGIVVRHEHRNVLELLSTVLPRLNANAGG